MAEVEEPQFSTLAERIAALNQQKNFKAPPPGAGKRPPPPPPPNRPASSQLVTNGSRVTTPNSPSMPSRPDKSAAAAVESTPPLPRRTTTLADDEVGPRVLPPPLPTRSSTAQFSPALPPRRPSAQTLRRRRDSNSSDISYLSSVSTASLNHTVSSATSAGSDGPSRRLPPPLEQAKLPPLPPTRRELEAKAREEAASQVARTPVQSVKSAPIVSRIAEPPQLPTRPARCSAAEPDERGPALPARRIPPPSTTWNRAKSATETGRVRPDDAPPPVPLSSRPTFDQIKAVATRSTPAPSASNSCLVCRDFSGPDAVAERYPYWELPRQDTVGYLAHVLCDPFPSATDKARAIFTWCHHNIAYDVEGFFNKCIPRGQTLDQTIFSGKAVCEGYAKVYEGIARRVGLECVVVGGHGKGYGFTALAPGQRPPPRDATGHAWNAVRIDGGEWKLLDACWGAGALADRQYMKRFEPQMFVLSNELFGLKHFPADSRHFYRSDGRIPGWEEYIVGPLKGEPAQWYCHAGKEGLNEFTFSPQEKEIPVRSGEVVRFQFNKICPHWDGEKHGRGKPLLLMMKIYGVNGQKEDLVPLDNDGFWWWIDIPARDLGPPGKQLNLLGLTKVNDQDARGMTKAEFERAKGRKSMSWDYIVSWQLV